MRKGLANTSDLSHFAGEKEATKLSKQKIQNLFSIRGIKCSQKNQVLGILNNIHRLSKEQLTALLCLSAGPKAMSSLKREAVSEPPGLVDP